MSADGANGQVLSHLIKVEVAAGAGRALLQVDDAISET